MNAPAFFDPQSAQPTLETGRLYLRPFTLADACEVQKMAGEREVAAMTYRLPHPYPDGMAEEWIRGQEALYRSGREVVFAVTLKPSGQLLGSIGLTCKFEHERAEVGYWLGKPFWGQGYATEAVLAVLGYGFKQLGLRRIFAQVFDRNEASAKVLKKAGLRFEGHLRQHVKKWDRFEDIRIFSVLSDEWRR